ncbi:hypothetical protein WJX74_007698 [Apatococcus lobatus]|uniref:Ribosome assembly protein 1 n=1 Tax=Apatococcus lobatus TaxID=904363 RepID=A0AAW1QBZ4_9CHLO
MQVSVERLTELQGCTERIRNLCILAHVDHGKTTLSDHLIASNGLIHPRLVGEMRYLDSRDDEQRRGITMKSSSISLLHTPRSASGAAEPQKLSVEGRLQKGYLINLIDSPGHVDFCSEVSTAARLSDGGLVVVDAVEGVCIQTHAVLRQAWQEKIKLCLVINKLDRLITEVRMSPQEAYERIKNVISHVNMVLSGFQSEQHISDTDAVLALSEEQAHKRLENGEEEEEEEVTFSPELGNVVFASAMDGWGFGTKYFAQMYAARMGFSAAALEQCLWGDFRIDGKTKKVMRIKRDQQQKYKPLFVQLALEPLWKAYEVLERGADHKAMLLSMAKRLDLKQVSEKALGHPDAKQALKTMLRAWLPLSDAVLGMALEQLPDPRQSMQERTPHLLPPLPPAAVSLSAATRKSIHACTAAIQACSTDPAAPCTVYVSKMVAVPASAIPRRVGELGIAKAADEEVFLAFGRVFSGVLRDGQTVHVLPATYNPTHPESNHLEIKVDGLFLMMGRGLERLAEVPAGNVLGIGGLGTAILKSATLASTPLCRPLAPMLFQAAPIVRVAVEPAHPTEMQQLVDGLRLLNQADPFVELTVMESGEQVLGAAGEVHLETCIKDLRERFARIELQVSPPLVAFRESVFCPAEAPDIVAEPAKVVEALTANGCCTVRVRAHALPRPLAALLEDSADILRPTLTRGDPTSTRAGSSTAHSTTAQSNGHTEAAGEAAAPAASNGMHSRRPPQSIRTTESSDVPNGVVYSVGEETSCAPAASLHDRRAPDDDSQIESSSRGAGVGEDALPGSSRAGDRSAAAADADGSALQEEQYANGADEIRRRSHGDATTSSTPHLEQGEDSHTANGDATEVGDAMTALQRKLAAQLQEADPELRSLLQRTWLLGPRRIGPNMLASSAPGQQKLWQVPASLVTRLGKRHANAETAAAEAFKTDGQTSESQSMTGEQDHIGIRVGLPEAATQLGLVDASRLQQASLAQQPLTESERILDDDSSEAQHALAASEYVQSSIESGVSAGFQLATSAGPLCDEPLWGVAFEVEAVLNGGAASTQQLAEDVYGPFSGQVTSAARQAFRRALLEANPRLVEAMFLCEVATASEALSGVYAVLGQRRAKVLQEQMREGSDVFSIHAFLPAEASFGLADDMRRRSSGAASASLMLSHWERLQVNPFFIPKTEEEREEFGEEGQGVGTQNLAKALIDKVRRRKGLLVERRVVESATKQRTRARKV